MEAFRSTLEETAEADLLLHVVDASDALPEDQIKAVREVLVEIGEQRDGTMPRELLVVNKIDAAGDLQLARLRHLLPDAVFVSARTGDGHRRLRARIAELLPRPEVEVEVLLPYAQGSLVARVHAEGEVLAEEHTADGTRMRARVGAELATAVLPYLAAAGCRPGTGPARGPERRGVADPAAAGRRRCPPRCSRCPRRWPAARSTIRGWPSCPAWSPTTAALGDGRRRPAGAGAPARPGRLRGARHPDRGLDPSIPRTWPAAPTARCGSATSATTSCAGRPSR